MVIVALLISLVVTIALPQLLPAILFSNLDGAARHVAGYGRAAMVHATLTRQPITVRFDLDKRQYWAIRFVQHSQSIFDDDKDKDGKDGKKDSARDRSSAGEGKDTLDLMHRGGGEGEGDEMLQNADAMREQFDEFVRLQMMARSKQIKREGILDDIGPLFDKKFSLDSEEEKEEELVDDPLLERTTLPEGVVIETIYVGKSSHSKGLVEVEISALGLNEPVTFYLKNEDDDYFTVAWDPITGGVHFERGKKDLDQMSGSGIHT
jgi:type II secretory pathway pseudopilin PulG